jgi:hypothetical protein
MSSSDEYQVHSFLLRLLFFPLSSRIFSSYGFIKEYSFGSIAFPLSLSPIVTKRKANDEGRTEEKKKNVHL